MPVCGATWLEPHICSGESSKGFTFVSRCTSGRWSAVRFNQPIYILPQRFQSSFAPSVLIEGQLQSPMSLVKCDMREVHAKAVKQLGSHDREKGVVLFAHDSPEV